MTMTMGGQHQQYHRHNASPSMMGVRGGNTFSSCLERAIRRRPVAAAAADTGLALASNVDFPVPLAQGNLDDGMTAPIKEETEDGGDEEDEDWSSHHISYPLLLSTLSYFSRRRAGVRARMVQLQQTTMTTTTQQRRDSNNSNYAIDGDIHNDKYHSNDRSSSILLSCCCCVGGSDNRPQLSEEEFNLVVNEYANQAPFWKRDHDDKKIISNEKNADAWSEGDHSGAGEGGSTSNNNLMQYAEQRALGRTPPGGRRTRKVLQPGNLKKNDTIHEVAVATQYDDATGSPSTEEVVGGGSSSSPYLRMGMEGEGNYATMNTNNNILPTTATKTMAMLDETEITKRLSYMERSELSAVLDSESERAATFYRSRISKLAPPRMDGGTSCSALFSACGDFDMPYDVDNEEDDGLIAPSQEREHFSFTDMASEILELHAFITTNIIVVRQVLIKYDAFVRSLGGTPMGSWYQTTRRQRVKGRSSDYLDLVNHSKLKTLTSAYILEYERHHLEDDGDEEDANAFNVDDYMESNDRMGDQSRRRKRGGKRRLTNLSRAFYQLVDASEEMKKRQRLKWRQSAMHIGDDDVNYFAPEETMELVDAGNDAAPHSNTIPLDSIPEVSTQSPPVTSANVARSGDDNNQLLEHTTQTSTFLPSTPTPKPPLHPVPDYSTLKKQSDRGEDIGYQVHIFKCVQSKTERSIEKTYSGRISGARDNILYTLRELFLLGSVSDNLSLMPEYLIMRGKSLKSSLLVVAQWREARDSYRYGVAPVNTSRDDSPSSGGVQPCSSYHESFALFLNISACFLYMMNYYIVMPSSIQYANALGAEDAMSGLIIGAMPSAAIFSAVLFSIWSNKCYRAPLLTSGVLLIAGNVLYAAAYRHQSIAMVLCGRFLTGLGGPRSMNRRFIADTTPLAQRTAANAAFGMATAMGAALGPASAILLDRIDIQFSLPLYGSVYINGMSGPGYLMGVLWFVYTLVLLLTFVEPQRSGLQEQIRNELLKESATKIPESANNASTYSELEMSNLEAPDSRVEFDDRFIQESYSFSTENGQYHIDSTDTHNKNTTTISKVDAGPPPTTLWQQAKFLSDHLTFPVRLCLYLLFTKMFTVESVISSASIVTKNRYLWAVQQVGTLGTIVGCMTIPISVFIGWASQYREDRILMLWLMSFATIGMGILIDVSDFVSSDTETYNEGNAFAVGSRRYIAGYLLVFCSVQAFDGVVGSMLSKVIPTALATGTLVSFPFCSGQFYSLSSSTATHSNRTPCFQNSGLLATVVGTVSKEIIP